MSPRPPVIDRSVVTARESRPPDLSKALLVGAALIAGVTVSLQVRAAIDRRRPLPGGGVEGPCTIWFVGSSTIRRWPSLGNDFRPWQAHNRGQDGALLSEIATRLAHDPPGAGPAALVFYGGENDIAEGIGVDRTLADLRAIVALKRDRLGATPLFLVGQKPSPTRWMLAASQQAYTAGLQRIAAGTADLHAVPVAAEFLIGGRPGPYYADDGIHLNPAGYAILTRRIAGALAHDLPAPLVRRCADTARSG